MTLDIRIASYNIRKALGTDRRRDPERIASVIAALNADVTVLQEADLRLGARPAALSAALITSQTGLVPIEVARSPVSLGWHGNAILIRPTTKVVRIVHLDLPGLEPRGALVADLDTATGPIRVAGVHLGLLRRSRRLQLTRLIGCLADLPPRPTIITGDFNEFSNTVGLGRLSRQFTLHMPGRTFHARKPFVALDRFVTNGLLDLRDMGVMHTPMTALASDHLPIWARAVEAPAAAQVPDETDHEPGKDSGSDRDPATAQTDAKGGIDPAGDR